MHKIADLSVTEAKLFIETQCAQDMLYAMHGIEKIELKVKKPMQLKLDNKCAKDLANNYSVGERTCHIDVRQYFLRDIKKQGIIETEWIIGEKKPSDLFTKNLLGSLFKKHMNAFVSEK